MRGGASTLTRSIRVFVGLAMVAGGTSVLFRVSDGGAPDDLGPTVGATVYRSLKSTGDRERLAVFDATGRARLCAGGRSIRVLATTPERIVFEWFRDRRGEVFEVDAGCATEPTLIVALTERAGIRWPFIECASIRDDGLLTLSYEGRGESVNTITRDEGDWRTVTSFGSCEWLDADRFVVRPEDTHFARTSPFAASASTGELSFFSRPRLWTGTPSPDGRLTYSPVGSWSRVMDVSTGATVARLDDQGSESPDWSQDGRYLLLPGEGLGPTQLFDVTTGQVTDQPSIFWEYVRTLTPGLVARSRRNGLILFDLESGSRTRVTLPGERVGAFQSPIIAHLRPAAAPIGLDAVPASEVPTIRFPFGVEVPLPPGWRARPCRGPGCAPGGYRLHTEFHPPVPVSKEGEPAIAFGATRDDMRAVASRMGEGRRARCNYDRDPFECKSISTTERQVGGRSYLEVELLEYEWVLWYCLSRVSSNTVIVASRCPGYEDTDPVRAFIRDGMRVTGARP